MSGQGQKPASTSCCVTEVAEFLVATPHAKRDVLLALREIVLAAAPGLHEHIKWNAPSYQSGGEDRITFNLSKPDLVQIVFHRGAKAVDTKTGKRLVEDTSRYLRWATDQRAYVAFTSLAEVEARREWLAGFVPRWIVAASV